MALTVRFSCWLSWKRRLLLILQAYAAMGTCHMLILRPSGRDLYHLQARHSPTAHGEDLCLNHLKWVSAS